LYKGDGAVTGDIRKQIFLEELDGMKRLNYITPEEHQKMSNAYSDFDAERRAYLEKLIKILAAASRLLVTEGYDALTHERIAKAAGVNKSSIRNNFGSKAAVVAADEYETKGLREILNFGHTFGHALETLTGYRAYCHGEAVAIGMVMAGTLAVQLELFPAPELARLQNLLALAGLPITVTRKLPAGRMLELLHRDKKAQAGTLRFVLPVRIGAVTVKADIPDNKVREVLA
jgi:3-dehydroquinate synthase